MSSAIVVGFDGSEHAHDALALGELLARALGAELTAACVYVFRPIHREGDAEMEAVVRERALEQAERARAAARGPEPRIRVVRGHSAAAGLHELAASSAADLIVVGSTRHGPLGRVMTRGMPEALMHDAPCAVAVAPRGYAAESGRTLHAVGVGFDGGPESTAALTFADAIARAAGARLEVITVLEPAVERASPHSFDVERRFEHDESLRRVLRRDLEHAVADLENPDAVPVEIDGLATDALCERSRQLDLLVLGSRCFGAIRRVLLGSVASAVLRHASSPVVVVPRSGRDSEPMRAATTEHVRS